MGTSSTFLTPCAFRGGFIVGPVARGYILRIPDPRGGSIVGPVARPPHSRLDPTIIKIASLQASAVPSQDRRLADRSLQVSCHGFLLLF